LVIGCSSVTDLQNSSENEGLYAGRLLPSSKYAPYAQGPRSIKCLPTNNVVKRKDERRESLAATNQFRRAFLQHHSFSSLVEGRALSIARPERLFELSGTPPPVFCC
jgi:hypothetical protein